MVSYKVFGAVTVLYATGADAFFRMECRGQLAQARIDPLMDFGTFGSHMHTIHGSSGMSSPSSAVLSHPAPSLSSAYGAGCGRCVSLPIMTEVLGIFACVQR